MVKLNQGSAGLEFHVRFGGMRDSSFGGRDKDARPMTSTRDDPSRLPAWLAETLRERQLEGKLAKVRESRHAERHVFIYVDRYTLPFDVHSLIAFSSRRTRTRWT